MMGESQVQHMTELEIRTYLRDNGYPEHIVRSGSDGLLARWREFVREAERGYEFGLEDYRNDLDIRGLIRLIGREEEVQEADERFRALLTALDQRVWESGDRDPWWDFGYPHNVKGDLRRDLKSEGLWEEPQGRATT
jgi:hypothetical protein